VACATAEARKAVSVQSVEARRVPVRRLKMVQGMGNLTIRGECGAVNWPCYQAGEIWYSGCGKESERVSSWIGAKP
jgi:hypothetical protein